MKKKIIVITVILAVLLVLVASFTSSRDKARVRNAVEPKYALKIVSQDGNRVTYWGLGYKVVRYPSVSPNEPYKNNRGVKYGSWFMKYELPTDSSQKTSHNIKVKDSDISLSFANYSDANEIYFGALNRDKLSINSVKHLPIYKFDTLADLEQFKNTFKNILTFNSGWDEVASFNDATSKYDETFFKDNSLMLVYISANNSTHRYGVNSVFCDGEAFCVHLEEITKSDTVDCAMSGWFVTVAVPDSLILKCTEFDADLDEF